MKTTDKIRAGAGVATGTATALGGQAAAMGIATTFGTASTGTAISTLSGAAATNAAMVWLGGGGSVSWRFWHGRRSRGVNRDTCNRWRGSYWSVWLWRTQIL